MNQQNERKVQAVKRFIERNALPIAYVAAFAAGYFGTKALIKSNEKRYPFSQIEPDEFDLELSEFIREFNERHPEYPV